MSFAIVLFSPVTVADSRDKANPFRRPSILFRPHDPQTKDIGGAAGYRPRVRSAYYERVYVHSSTREHGLYSALFTGCKGGVRISIRIFRRELTVTEAKRERRTKGYSKLRWPLFMQLYWLAEQFMTRPLSGGAAECGPGVRFKRCGRHARQRHPRRACGFRPQDPQAPPPRPPRLRPRSHRRYAHVGR